MWDNGWQTIAFLLFFRVLPIFPAKISSVMRNMGRYKMRKLWETINGNGQQIARLSFFHFFILPFILFLYSFEPIRKTQSVEPSYWSIVHGTWVESYIFENNDRFWDQRHFLNTCHTGLEIVAQPFHFLWPIRTKYKPRSSLTTIRDLWMKIYEKTRITTFCFFESLSAVV